MIGKRLTPDMKLELGDWSIRWFAILGNHATNSNKVVVGLFSDNDRFPQTHYTQTHYKATRKPVQWGTILKLRGKSRRKKKGSGNDWTANFFAMWCSWIFKFWILQSVNFCQSQIVKSSKSKTMQELIGLCQLQLLVESRSRYRECRYKHNREGEIVILNVDEKWNLVTNFGRGKCLT